MTTDSSAYDVYRTPKTEPNTFLSGIIGGIVLYLTKEAWSVPLTPLLFLFASASFLGIREGYYLGRRCEREDTDAWHKECLRMSLSQAQEKK